MASAHETLSYEPQASSGRIAGRILAAARDGFMRTGYGDTSMDWIAKAAGVSKATLYSHFDSKPQLFAAMIGAECRRVALALVTPSAGTLDTRKTLLGAGEQFLEFLTSPAGLAMFRLVVGETARFPELGVAFYECAPAEMKARLSAYLAAAAARGELAIEDAELASMQFLGMVKGDIHLRCLFDQGYKPTAAELRRSAQGAVDTFLCRYGPPSGKR